MSTALERRAERFIKKHLTRSALKSSSFRSNAEKNNLGNWCAVDPFRQIVIEPVINFIPLESSCCLILPW